MAVTIELKDNTVRSRMLQLISVAIFFVLVANLTFQFYRYESWCDFYYGTVNSSEVAFVELLNKILLTGISVLSVIWIVIFSLWMHRAVKNLIEFQLAPLTYHSSWAFWHWIVPFYSFRISHSITAELAMWYEQILIKNKLGKHRKYRLGLITLCWLLGAIGTAMFALGLIPAMEAVVLLIVANILLVAALIVWQFVLVDLRKLEKTALRVKNVNHDFDQDVIDSNF
ncbi:MAG: hypothetical protein ACFHU9_02690 [Fluviicola sp.]